MAFTLDEASRLTGLSESQIRRWDVDGFFQPAFADPNRNRPFSRIFSFLDLVALRTIARINERGVPIARIKRVGEFLKTLPEASWASTRFYVAGKDVFLSHDEALIAVNPLGQQAMKAIVSVDLQPIVVDTRERVQKLTERTSDQFGRVVRDRFIMGGQPVIDGTRIPTATIVEFVQMGYDTDRILRNFPRLVPADIAAALNEEASASSPKQSA